MHYLFRIFSAAALFALLSPLPLQAGPFDKGSQSISLIVGSGRSFNEDYIIVGGGYGYYVFDGLELGLDAQAWLSGDPGIYKLTPKVNYVFNVGALRPYVGAFYRRAWIDGFEDLDSAGYRAGLYFLQQSGMYFGAGVVYESYQDCTETIFNDCSSTYPEIIFSFSF